MSPAFLWRVLGQIEGASEALIIRQHQQINVIIGKPSRKRVFFVVQRVRTVFSSVLFSSLQLSVF